jgi:hypothetical protein
MDDLFGNKTIYEALRDNRVSRGVYNRWKKEPRWQEAINERIQDLEQECRIGRAKGRPVATSALVELADSGQGYTSRLACKDLLEMERPEEAAARPETGTDRHLGVSRYKQPYYGQGGFGNGRPVQPLKPEIARKLLRALAEMKDEEMSPSALPSSASLSG